MAAFAPRITSIVETHTPDGAKATITLQVDLVELEHILNACDLSGVQGAGLEKIRDSAATLRKIREAEASSGASPINVAAEPDEAPELPPAPASDGKTGQDLVDHLVDKETSS